MNTETKKSETYVSPQVGAILLCMAPGESLMVTSQKGDIEGYDEGDDFEW